MKYSLIKPFFYAFLVWMSAAAPLLAEDSSLIAPEARRAVKLTVYQQNLTYVQETLGLSLQPGRHTLRLENISPQLIAESVLLKPLESARDFRILEQTFDYDLASPQALLEKYVGRQIKLVVWHEYQDRKEIVDAELLSANGPVYRIDGEIYLGHPGTQVLPEVPGEFSLKPALVWDYESKQAVSKDFELRYLTGGISWSAHYTLTLDEKNMTAGLAGWVMLDNHSGVDYDEASLTLVAGQVARQYAPQPMMAKNMMVRSMAMDSAEAAPFEQQQAFDYYQYTLQHKTSIGSNERKQIQLLEGGPVSVKKEYRVVSTAYYGRFMPDQTQKLPVQIYLEFINDKKNGLAESLPQGVVRVFSTSPKGETVFAGEASIPHTPRDEKVSLKVGDAFDLTAERRQTAYEQISNQLSEAEWEIVLSNRKDKEVVFILQEALQGNWKILSHSHAYKKKDAFTVSFEVPVPAGKEVKVKYRVRQGI